MLYKDGNGFPLTLKPSHLFGSTERMETAEVLAMIVEQACYNQPETAVGTDSKRPKKAFSEEEKVPKEAFSNVKSPKEKLSEVEKVSVASVSPNLVRFK